MFVALLSLDVIMVLVVLDTHFETKSSDVLGCNCRVSCRRRGGHSGRCAARCGSRHFSGCALGHAVGYCNKTFHAKAGELVTVFFYSTISAGGVTVVRAIFARMYGGGFSGSVGGRDGGSVGRRVGGRESDLALVLQLSSMGSVRDGLSPAVRALASVLVGTVESKAGGRGGIVRPAVVRRRPVWEYVAVVGSGHGGGSMGGSGGGSVSGCVSWIGGGSVSGCTRGRGSSHALGCAARQRDEALQARTCVFVSALDNSAVGTSQVAAVRSIVASMLSGRVCGCVGRSACRGSRRGTGRCDCRNWSRKSGRHIGWRRSWSGRRCMRGDCGRKSSGGICRGCSRMCSGGVGGYRSGNSSRSSCRDICRVAGRRVSRCVGGY
jgi:hypothetical protein